MRVRLQILQDEIATIRSKAEGIKATEYDKARVQSSPDPDPLATYLGKLMEMEEQLSTELDQYLALYTQIFKEISGLGMGMLSDVLYLRYFDGLSLSDIAEQLGYSYDYTRHIHGIALQEFEHKYTHIHKLDTQ